tara:strand:+ start:253 stop:618 length:366 start_codon:yes stop_codon:yes gene_type:complete
MNYNWCHNPTCHQIETQSRVRGSGENKVLRTVKIPVHNPETSHIYDFFCNQNCLMQFLYKFAREVANIRPVNKPSETPIKIEKEKYEAYKYNYTGNGSYQRTPYQATRTKIQITELQNSTE